MKILIVDDDPDMRRLAAAFLRREPDMTVFEAGSGEEGLAVATRERPDAILLDVLMPGMDGVATFEQLRADPATAPLAVIFLTAETTPGERERLARLSGRDVLSKPFTPSTLAANVRRLL